MATNGGHAIVSTERDTDPNKEDEMLVGAPDRISGERTGFVGDHSMGFMLVVGEWVVWGRRSKLVERKVLEEERTCVMQHARHLRGSHVEGRTESCQRKELQLRSGEPVSQSDNG